jgi:hypothetical protein
MKSHCTRVSTSSNVTGSMCRLGLTNLFIGGRSDVHSIDRCASANGASSRVSDTQSVCCELCFARMGRSRIHTVQRLQGDQGQHRATRCSEGRHTWSLGTLAPYLRSAQPRKATRLALRLLESFYSEAIVNDNRRHASLSEC